MLAERAKFSKVKHLPRSTPNGTQKNDRKLRCFVKNPAWRFHAFAAGDGRGLRGRTPLRDNAEAAG